MNNILQPKITNRRLNCIFGLRSLTICMASLVAFANCKAEDFVFEFRQDDSELLIATLVVSDLPAETADFVLLEFTELGQEIFGFPVIYPGEFDVSVASPLISDGAGGLRGNIGAGDFTDDTTPAQSENFESGTQSFQIFAGLSGDALVATPVDLSIDDRIAIEGEFRNVILGDLDRDGTVSLLDISPFVDVLVSNSFDYAADFNADGLTNLQDIAPFVSRLTN